MLRSQKGLQIRGSGKLRFLRVRPGVALFTVLSDYVEKITARRCLRGQDHGKQTDDCQKDARSGHWGTRLKVGLLLVSDRLLVESGLEGWHNHGRCRA